MLRVIVTGGSGLVGRFITEYFLSRGNDIVVTGRCAPSPDFFSGPVTFRSMPLDPAHDYRPLFAGADVVVHGAFAHVPGKYRGGEGDDPDAFRRANLDGTVRILNDAKAVGVPRFVFLSSRAAYPPMPPGTPLTEDMTGTPESLYGIVKQCAEDVAAALAAPDFCPVSLRITGVYGSAGPGVDHKWTGLFSDYLGGGGVPVRIASEVHGDDVGRAVECVATAEAPLVSGKMFNVSDVVVDTRDILTPLAELCGYPHHLPARGDAATVSAMSTARLSALGWVPGGRTLFDQTTTELAHDFTKR